MVAVGLGLVECLVVLQRRSWHIHVPTKLRKSPLAAGAALV